ncbi:MAG: hypothetical protein GC182_21845 [Rhodopseudomonas sp.]|nr:hypothetical protein [Rhodopseudomonas sp.]
MSSPARARDLNQGTSQNLSQPTSQDASQESNHDLNGDLESDPTRDGHRNHDRRRRDQVRHAVEAGEIKSLADILQAVRSKVPGDVAGVEVERDDGRWRYELRVVDDKGRLYEVTVDASSGEIERIKEK